MVVKHLLCVRQEEVLRAWAKATEGSRDHHTVREVLCTVMGLPHDPERNAFVGTRLSQQKHKKPPIHPTTAGDALLWHHSRVPEMRLWAVRLFHR